jgi:hypothetical protein
MIFLDEYGRELAATLQQRAATTGLALVTSRSAPATSE